MKVFSYHFSLLPEFCTFVRESCPVTLSWKAGKNATNQSIDRWRLMFACETDYQDICYMYSIVCVNLIRLKAMFDHCIKFFVEYRRPASIFPTSPN